MDKEIFEVTRMDYKSFLRSVKPEYRVFKKEAVSDRREAMNMYSGINNVLLGGREYDIIDDDNRMSEKYYIYNLPCAEESVPPQPVVQVVLETKEEVQQFLDYYQKLKR